MENTVALSYATNLQVFNFCWKFVFIDLGIMFYAHYFTQQLSRLDSLLFQAVASSFGAIVTTTEIYLYKESV